MTVRIANREYPDQICLQKLLLREQSDKGSLCLLP